MQEKWYESFTKTTYAWFQRDLLPLVADLLTLLANSLPRGDQGRKGGDIGFRGLGMSEPGHDAFQIDANCNQNVLEMSFRQANVARPPEIKGPDPL
jgi:hypothetical protein